MEKAGPLTTEIAASVEEVKALLENNRSLSVAFLSRRMRDLEEEVRERFKKLESRVTCCEGAAKKATDRFEQAGVKYKEMREELDTLRGRGGKKATA